jgi:hypothetical protein
MDHLVLRHPSYMRGFTYPFSISVWKGGGGVTTNSFNLKKCHNKSCDSRYMYFLTAAIFINFYSKSCKSCYKSRKSRIM